MTPALIQAVYGDQTKDSAGKLVVALYHGQIYALGAVKKTILQDFDLMPVLH